MVLHKTDQQPKAFQGRHEQNIPNTHRTYPAQRIPIQIQKKGERAMPRMWSRERDHATFPPGMSCVRTQKKENGAEERRTGAEICRYRCKRRKDSHIGSLHQDYRKILGGHTGGEKRSRHRPRGDTHQLRRTSIHPHLTYWQEYEGGVDDEGQEEEGRCNRIS